MKKLLISPYSKFLSDGQLNAKNFPYWNEVVNDLKNKIYMIQIGVQGEQIINNIDEYFFDLSLKEIKNKILECNLWISVDNFMNHLGSYMNKKGIVIFSKSNPNIFGYKNNINLLKDIKYLRLNQFYIWKNEPYDLESFTDYQTVVKTILENI